MESSTTPELIAELRLLVGYLGEKDQFNWWGSGFLAPTSEAFLSPIFPRTVWLAKYHGVSEAACLVHDDRIGVGKNFHLYRLPDSLERSSASVVEAVVASTGLQDKVVSVDAALTRLRELASPESEIEEGPVNLGESFEGNFEMQWSRVARIYLDAFQAGVSAFPFVRGRN